MAGRDGGREPDVSGPSFWSRVPAHWIVLALGAALSLYVVSLGNRINDSLHRSHLNEGALRLSYSLESELRRDAGLLATMRYFVSDAEDLSRLSLAEQVTEFREALDAFDLFVEGIAPQHDALEGLFWLPRVPNDQVSLFQTFSSLVYKAPYRVRDPDSANASEDRPYRFPVFNFSPAERRGDYEGVDLGAFGHCHDAIARAYRLGTPAACVHGPETVSGGRTEVMLFAPVYVNPNLAGDTPSLFENLSTVAAGVFRVDGVFAAVSDPALDRRFSIVRTGDGAQDEVVYRAALSDRSAPPARGITVSNMLHFGGLEWRIETWSATSLAGPFYDRGPMAAGLAAFVVSTLLALYLYRFQNHARWVEKAVAARTSDLAQSEDRYRKLVETSPLGVLVVADDRIQYANAAAAALVGEAVESLIDRRFSDFVAPDAGEAVGDGGADSEYSRESNLGEIEVRSVGGDVKRVVLSSVPIEYQGRTAHQTILYDVTERHALEQQLRHSQKMEAIGTMAGGIAHDFNNLLVSVIMHAEFLKEVSEPWQEAYMAAHTIENAAQRAADLTSQLLGFARSNELKKTRVDLHAAIKAVIELTSRSTNKDVDIVTELNADRHVLLGDLGQIEQVVLNLVLNGAEAMPDGGVLTIETRDGLPTTHSEREEAAAVELIVSDTGTGIAERDLERVFDPFFTTKEKGTGMGLSVAFGIVKSHQGEISVTSNLGAGTVFRVRLPVLDTNETADDGGPETSSVVTGRGRVLVVEDEPVVQEAVFKCLSRAGYTVIQAYDGIEGLDAFTSDTDGFDAVIMDLVMPRMDGAQCLSHIRELNGEVPVILTTGFDRDGAFDRASSEVNTSFIAKPFRYSELSRIVAESIGKQRTA